MKKKILVSILSSALLLSSFSQLTVLAAVTDGINAADETNVMDEILKLADDFEIIINRTVLENLSSVTYEKLGSLIIDARPEEGFATSEDVQTAYDTALAECTAVIDHPMTGDIVLTQDVDENYFNGIGNDTPAFGKLTQFALTDDIDVEPDYIVSVVYNLTNKSSSGMCTAASQNQDWNIYLSNIGFDEFSVTKNEIAEALEDTSMLLLTLNDRARSTNSFDITENYKKYIGNISGDVFSLRTEIKDYQTIFYPEELINRNYITYIIDTTAIQEDLKSISDSAYIEDFIINNGGALGIYVQLYERIPDKSELNDRILEANGDIEAINGYISEAADGISIGKQTITSVGSVMKYENDYSGQGLPASVSDNSGAIWTSDRSNIKAMYRFDFTQIPAKYLMSAMFNVTRNSGGHGEGVIRKITPYAAVSDEYTDQYLKFVPIKDKYYSTQINGANENLDVTDYVDEGYLFIAFNGIDVDCYDNSAAITLSYNTDEILGAFENATILEASRLIDDYGKILGMTDSQMQQKSKVAIGLAGKVIGSLDEFTALVNNAIANISQDEILSALNGAEDIEQFTTFMTELGSSLGIDLSLIQSLDDERKNNIYTQMFNGGEPYESVAEFTSRYNSVVDDVFGEMLSGIDPYDTEITKDFLLEYGELLGISREDLDNDIDVLALAFTQGREISTITEFLAIYENYQDEASKSILVMINNSQDSAEFDSLIRKYADTLGLDLTLYNQISDIQGLFESVAGATEDKEYFVTFFNNEVSKYFGEPVVVYAIDESMQDPSSTQPNNNNYEGWTGNASGTCNYIRYDISSLADINPEGIASVTVSMQISDRSEMADTVDKTGELYSIKANWNGAVDSYKTMSEKGVFDDIKLVGTDFIEGNVNAGTFVIDVTDYIKELIAAKETAAAFKFAVAEGGVIMRRKGDSTTFAPMSVTYLDAAAASVVYTPQNGSTDISINPEIKIDFGKPIEASSAETGITVKDAAGNNVVCKKTVSTNTVTITFPNALQYETTYTVDISKDVKYVGDTNKYVFNSLSFVTEKRPFEFKGLVVKSGGEQITSLADRTSNTLSVSAIVNNNSDAQNHKVIVMVGLYRQTDNYMELVDIKTVSKDLSMGTSASVNTEFTIPDDGTYKITCNVWDSLTNMNKLFSETIN